MSPIYFSVEKSQYKEANTNALNTFLANLEVIEFGYKEELAYAKIRADLEYKKSLIGAMDMLISAVALANDLTLITNNTKEFQRVGNLNIENWV